VALFKVPLRLVLAWLRAALLQLFQRNEVNHAIRT